MTPAARRWVIASAIGSIVLVALLISAQRVRAESCQPAESQSWWAKDGISIPSNVGQHIHLGTCLPTGIVNSTLNLPVTVTLHNQTGAVKWIRACRESTYCQRWDVSLGPCSDCSATYTLPINVGAWPTGRQELRLTANVSSNSDGLRQFQSTGWPLNVRATSPCDRCNVFWTARGWYTNHAYQNAGLLSPPSALGSGATIKVRLGPGSGGLTTRLAGVYIDPAFHSGSAGTVVAQWSSSYTGTVTLPSLVSGAHRLVLLSSDGFDAGVLSVGFVVP